MIILNKLSSLRAQRRQYSHLGWAMAILLGFSLLLPNLSVLIVRAIFPGFEQHSWALYFVTYSLFYLLGYPYIYIFLRLRTVAVPPKSKMKPTEFFAATAVCIALTYAGSIMGNLLNSVIGLIRGKMPENQLQSLVDNNDLWVIILLVVIIGPILEEVIFRKALVDLLYPLGEPACVLFGALVFGLIHGNFYQFFYAALLGALFTLIYCRTGKLRYTILLHMILNFQGSVISQGVLSLVDKEALMNSDIGAMLNDNFFGTLIYFGYTFLLLAIAVAGVALLIIGYKKLRLKKSAVPLQKPIRAALLNPGMILFLLTGIVLIALKL